MFPLIEDVLPLRGKGWAMFNLIDNVRNSFEPTCDKTSPFAIFDSINPGVTIVIPISGPNSVLKVSKKEISAALLAWIHHRFRSNQWERKGGVRHNNLEVLTL